METRIIRTNGAIDTYCHNCSENAVCAELSLKNWQYKVFICLKCLDEMRQKLSKQMVSLAQEPIPSPFNKEKVGLKT